jgi:CDP-diacylglycerol--serine O-phosphatidyltransferase
MDQESRPAPVLSPQNLVTLGNLACGVGAMLLAVQAVLLDEPQRFYHAALWLVLATFLDAIDGKLARFTGTASPLGAQLDSLADAVTFGVAPSVLASALVLALGPEHGLALHPRLILVAPIVYACCAVLRLARFNVDQECKDLGTAHAHFIGLPTPGAAALPIALVLFYFGIADMKLVQFEPATVEAWRAWMLRLVPVSLITVAILMVSRAPYPHFFAWMTRSPQPVATLAKFVVLAGVLFLEPEAALLLMAVLFTSVPLLRLIPALVRRPRTRAA